MIASFPRFPIFVVLALFTLSGCVSNGYPVEREPLGSASNTSGTSATTMPDPAKENNDGERVIYSLSSDYERDPPACVVVRSANVESRKSVLAGTVEKAVTIHLGGKIDRVIGGPERDRILRKQRLDPDHAGDARAFAWKTRCRAVLTWKLTAASETFMLAFGARKIGLELVLKRFGKNQPLWQARHVTSRSGGGLPLSPVGLVLDTVRAGQFMDYKDMLPSMIHDVIRRLFQTLPNTF